MKTQQDIKAIRPYILCRADGRRIRVATLVEFTDGRIIRFMDKMPKYLAILNALFQVNKSST